MKDPLMDMGMEDAFSSGVANFQGVNGGNDLWLTEFSQLNQIKVSGDTPLPRSRRRVLSRRFLRSQNSRQLQSREYKLHFERQFMYAVRHNPSGMILQIGRYYVPDNA